MQQHNPRIWRKGVQWRLMHLRGKADSFQIMAITKESFGTTDVM
jgi:hypothetical protein